MLNKTILSVVLILALYSVKAQHISTFNISEEKFRSEYKYDDISQYKNSTTYIIKDTIYGIAEEWSYIFENGELDHVSFLSYIDEIDQKNFDLNLNAAKQLTDDFTNIYGNPDDIIIGDTLFNDPYDKLHWGYDVIEARWKNVNGMKIKIEFDFFGGKGEYHFIFSVNYFDKMY